jgi:hypothetical protein
LLISSKVWNAITSEYTPVGVVDDLFSLPSPVAVVSLLYKYPKLKLLPLIGLAILIQALVLVSILAPGALLVDWKLATHRNITIPKLDLVTVPTRTDPIWWMEVAKYFMFHPPFESWNVPVECGQACGFDIVYQAPGISCRQMSEQETPLKPFDLQLYESGQQWNFYSSNSTFQMTWGTNDLPLNFSFVPMISRFSANTLVSVNQTGPIQGQLCEFHDRTYQVHFNYTDNIKSGTIEAISESNDFTQNCSWTSGASLSPDCSHYASAATNMSLGYSAVFVGTGGWNINGMHLDFQQLPLIQFIDYIEYTPEQTRELTPPDDISKLLEDSFANVVLGILLRLDQIGEAPALVLVGNTWLFFPHVLWMVYTPALFLVLVAGLCGLRWARQSDIVREKKFSSFLIATRTESLDAVCNQHSNAVLSARLRNDAQTGRFLVLQDAEADKSPSDPSRCSEFQ